MDYYNTSCDLEGYFIKSQFELPTTCRNTNVRSRIYNAKCHNMQSKDYFNIIYPNKISFFFITNIWKICKRLCEWTRLDLVVSTWPGFGEHNFKSTIILQQHCGYRFAWTLELFLLNTAKRTDLIGFSYSCYYTVTETLFILYIELHSNTYIYI